MTDTEHEGTFLRHVSCSNCTSSDANALYSDGHTYCFSCGHLEPAKDGAVVPQVKKRPKALIDGDVSALVKRKLTLETCEKFKYSQGVYHDKPCQIAPYTDAKGNLVAQKLRFADKSFTFLGDPKKAVLFGQQLWAAGGKKIVVTEGELDAMSVSQAQGNKWPVVSVPTGIDGAAKAFRANVEYLESFETVIIMFDNDEHGHSAAIECAEILSPGKAAIASLPLKDANEMLKAGRVEELRNAVFQAKRYQPDGIVNATALWNEVAKPLVKGVPYPWEGLNNITYGQRPGEIVTWCAGSGIGKSAVTAEIAYALINAGKTVGDIRLEENNARTARRYMGMYLNTPIHLPGATVSTDDLKRAFDATLGQGRLWLYDHFGSTDAANLLSKMRYLVVGCGVEYVILDHVSIVVSGMDISADERRSLDKLMTDLRSFVEETGVSMHLVSHLKRPEGRGHEDGAQTSLAQLRGSAAIGQLSDLVIGLERNQQAEDETERNVTTLRVLKNRYAGMAGEACRLVYNRITGRLHEVTEGLDVNQSLNEDF